MLVKLAVKAYLVTQKYQIKGQSYFVAMPVNA